jgi:hypothetical protein
MKRFIAHPSLLKVLKLAGEYPASHRFDNLNVTE